MTSSVRRLGGAAAIALATTLALAGCSDGSDDTTPAADVSTAQTPTTSEPAPADSPTNEPSDGSTEGSTQGSDGKAVPIYFAGDTPSGETRLFREFQRVTGDPLTEAARLVAGGGDPLDPDYRTLWPQMEISSVTAAHDLIAVVIPSDAFTERPDGMTRREARLAVQQLVYTLQGVQQKRLPVQIKRDGNDFRLFGLATDVPYQAKSALKTLNHVNITSPAEGDTISRNAGSGDTLKVTGVANSFEANVICELVSGPGDIMVTTPIMAAGWMGDRLFPFEGEIPLADAGTGKVLLRCSTDDPSGGTEGDGADIDTKSISVR